MNLTAMQKDIHEKDAQLNMSKERIVQLKQEIKFIETEYIQSRAIIMRLKKNIN